MRGKYMCASALPHSRALHIRAQAPLGHSDYQWRTAFNKHVKRKAAAVQGAHQGACMPTMTQGVRARSTVARSRCSQAYCSLSVP